MPAKFISKESWSRCDSPSTLYDAVRNPNAIYRPSVTVLPKDTIEITKRLRQERINKLDNKGLELSHDSYVAVVQVGKYMFFAVMLPVYLCCYSLPRWFFVNALPYLFEGVRNQAYNLGRHVIEISKKVADLMKGLLEQLIGNALRMTKERGKNLFRQLMRKFRNSTQKFTNGPRAMHKYLKDIKDSAAKRSQKLYKRAEKQVLERNARMRKKTFDKAKQSASWALRQLKKLGHAFLDPILKIVSIYFKYISSLVKIVMTFIDIILKKVKELIKKMMNPLVTRFKKLLKAAIEFCRKKFKRIVQPILKKGKTLKSTIIASIKKARQVFIKPITAFAVKASVKIKSMASWGINHAKEVLSTIISPFKPLLSGLKKVSKSIIKQVRLVMASIVTPIFDFIKKWGKKEVKWARNIFVTRLKLIKSTFQHMIALPRKGVESLTKTIKNLVSIPIRIIFTIQIVIAVLSISFTDGFQLVKETVQPYRL